MSGQTSAKKAVPHWRTAFFFILIPAIVGASAALVAANLQAGDDEDDETVIIYDDNPVATSIPPAPPSEPRVLTNAANSPDALAKHFLKALAQGDEAAMRSLRITKEEFCRYVFAELPASKVPNLTCDFAWQQGTLNSDKGLYEILPEHKGKHYELIAVRFEKGTISYDACHIHRDARLCVRDERGAEKELKLFGSILEINGKFKLFSLAVD
jgi:hypothetical protein